MLVRLPEGRRTVLVMIDIFYGVLDIFTEMLDIRSKASDIASAKETHMFAVNWAKTSPLLSIKPKNVIPAA